MLSSVTRSVESKPATTLPTESPTRTISTPQASTARAKSTSYAVTTTSFAFSRLDLAISRSVTRFELALSAMVHASQLVQLTLPEIAIRQFRMRDRQRLFGNLLPFDHHHVQVQCSRPPAKGANAAGRTLDPLQRG